MALTISKLKMWKDPGYTRNCPEMPPIGSKKLPATPDYSLTAGDTLRPHKGSTLTELHLPLSYSKIFDMSYLYIEATDGNGTIKLFGWITGIYQRSTAADGVTITWDVDWWRSYSGDITYKSGIITKSPDASHKRPYRTEPRYWTVKSVQELNESEGPTRAWCYIPTVWTKLDADGNKIITTIEILFAPVSAYFEYIPGGTPFAGPSYEYLFSGKLDEMIDGLSTSSVTVKMLSCFIAPIAPDDWSWDTVNTQWTIDANHGYAVVTNSEGDSLIIPPGTNYFPKISATKTITAVQTSDTERAAVTDISGNLLGYLPYGKSFTTVEFVLDVSATECRLDVTFPDIVGTGVTVAWQKRKAAATAGCSFSIPMLSIPITENAWNDYVVSGQRDYDITSARIANDQKAVSGLESTFSGTVGGAVAGASAGPLGAIGGAIGGLTGGLIITGVNYGLGENFNKQLQEATDQLYANQKNGIIISGNSRTKYDMDYNITPFIVILEADSVSAGEYSADVSLNGYDVNICGSLTLNGSTAGPYRIINMTVTGNVPPQAKHYIKDKFQQGIRIIENNPSGVTP